MPHPPQCKAELRKEIRRQRRELGTSAQHTAAAAAADNIQRLPGWTTASRVALYLASDGEIATTALITMSRRAGKQLFLPVIAEADQLTFAEWVEGVELVSNRYAIPEPPQQALKLPASELDIIILPLVAWDRLGGRLGMGGGFYDRALNGIDGPLRVGLAHALQEVPQVPSDDWDIPMDFIVTEQSLHQCRAQHDRGQTISPE